MTNIYTKQITKNVVSRMSLFHFVFIFYHKKIIFKYEIAYHIVKCSSVFENIEKMCFKPLLLCLLVGCGFHVLKIVEHTTYRCATIFKCLSGAQYCVNWNFFLKSLQCIFIDFFMNEAHVQTTHCINTKRFCLHTIYFFSNKTLRDFANKDHKCIYIKSKLRGYLYGL